MERVWGHSIKWSVRRGLLTCACVVMHCSIHVCSEHTHTLDKNTHTHTQTHHTHTFTHKHTHMYSTVSIWIYTGHSAQPSSATRTCTGGNPGISRYCTYMKAQGEPACAGRQRTKAGTQTERERERERDRETEREREMPYTRTHTHKHPARTYARTHARTHAHSHTHTHA
jgi:hypothetical protein